MPENEFVITVVDVETTGTNPARDQIIELSVKKGFEADSFQKTWRIKPSVPISPQAYAVHGISMEDLKDCKPFSAYVSLVQRVIDGSDALVGYNLEFDLSFLQSEFRRSGQAELDLRTKALIDPYRLWTKFEPRTLVDAHKRFVGEELKGAHGAAVDVQATARVLQGMLKSFKLEGKDWKVIADICGLGAKNWIGPTYHFQWQEDVVVFGFGKHKNRPIIEVTKEDGGGYLRWLSDGDFPEHVKQIAKNAQQKSAEELQSWLVATFGPSPTPR
jgi:DNA polymerase III subunit epsilon